MNKKFALIIGDMLAILLVTLIGFVTHREISTSYLSRFLATFLPLVTAWFITTPWLGLFTPEIYASPRYLWRIPLALLLAVPLAATLRSALLGSVVLPLFVLILCASASLAMLTWRAMWLAWQRQKTYNT